MAQKRGRDDPALALALNAKRAYVGDVAPGREYVEPRIYQQPQLHAPGAAPVSAGCMQSALRACRRTAAPTAQGLCAACPAMRDHSSRGPTGIATAIMCACSHTHATTS